MKRFERTIDNLLKIIDELKRENAQLRGGRKLRTCDVIESKEDLLDYINTYDNDYIIFITPGQFTMQMDREDIDRLTESGFLKKEINKVWEPGTKAIAVP